MRKKIKMKKKAGRIAGEEGFAPIPYLKRRVKRRGRKTAPLILKCDIFMNSPGAGYLRRGSSPRDRTIPKKTSVLSMTPLK